MHKTVVLTVLVAEMQVFGYFLCCSEWHTKKVRTGYHRGEYFTKTSVHHHNFALQSCYLQIRTQCCWVFTCSLSLLLQLRCWIFLLCRLNVPSWGLAYASCFFLHWLCKPSEIKNRTWRSGMLETCVSETCSCTALMDEGPCCLTASHRLTLIISLDHYAPITFWPNFRLCKENLEVEIAYVTTFVCSCH